MKLTEINQRENWEMLEHFSEFSSLNVITILIISFCLLSFVLLKCWNYIIHEKKTITDICFQYFPFNLALIKFLLKSNNFPINLYLRNSQKLRDYWNLHKGDFKILTNAFNNITKCWKNSNAHKTKDETKINRLFSVGNLAPKYFNS